MNLSRHQLLGRLVALLHLGRARLGNFQRSSSPRRREAPGRRHVLDVVVKSSRQAKRERSRRWRRGLKWSALTAAVAILATSSHQAVARYFWQNPELTLASSADIRTSGILSHDDILRHAGLNEETHVYRVDLRTVRERLEALPNVRHASVERELPGRLVITVEERLPVLWLSCVEPELRPYTADPDKGACLLDEEGHLFLCTELRPDVLRLPVLHLRRLNHSQAGVQLTAAPVQASLDLLRQLRDTFGPRGLDVTEIDAPNDWSLAVKFNNHLTITFGYQDMETQLDRLNRVLQVADERSVRLRTVNLLPRKNVPVTFMDEPAIQVSSTPTPPDAAAAGQGTQVPVSGRPVPSAAAENDRVAAQLEAILGGGR